ncbi:hypothetical protein MPER_11489, partial [Moniliophthora perniciosa FA553]
MQNSTPTVKDAESAYAKATRAELARDYNTAFQSYIKATELFLHLSRAPTTDEKKKEKWKNDADKALQRAEKIKQFTDRLGTRPGYGSVVARTHVQTTPPISLTPAAIDPIFPTGAVVYLEERWFCKWIGSAVMGGGVPGRFTVCLLAASILHPVTHDVYRLKLFFNGAWRRITIDSQLPYHPGLGIPLCLTCSPSQGNPILWPTLVEKGYMKLMGGYDFPGSNSSIDIHTLTGWIPEHLDVKSPNFERESTWTRLKRFAGHCMVTVGSGQYFHPDEGGLELLPSHSYAVIDMQDDGSERFITILDPWVRPSDSDLPIDQSS